MDPIDKEVCEEDEERELQVVVEREWGVGRGVVEFAVATDFGEEEGDGKDGHDREGYQGLSNLEPNLILKVLWVGECCVIEDEDVGEGGADEVDQETEDPTRVMSKSPSYRAMVIEDIPSNKV